jgi:hypothetical protein
MIDEEGGKVKGSPGWGRGSERVANCDGAVGVISV